MKKAIVCIFAHPDDEAFGPAGTIYKLASEYDAYVLCATKGEAGEGAEAGSPSLAEIRSKELLRSAKILGIRKVYFLGFRDGTLSNSLYRDLTVKIEKQLRRLKPEIILTFEPWGISGHIDHIAVSMATSYVFQKLEFIKEIYYYCITEEVRNRFENDYFIYFPLGYRRSEIEKVVDVSDVWDKKVAAMMAHASQKHDYERIIKMREGLSKEEHFLVQKH